MTAISRGDCKVLFVYLQLFTFVPTRKCNKSEAWCFLTVYSCFWLLDMTTKLMKLQ